jgi:hypothetical protein
MPYAMNAGIRIHYEVKGTGTPPVLHHELCIRGRLARFGLYERLETPKCWS